MSDQESSKQKIDDTPNIVNLYRSGWTLVEIAVEEDCKVKEVLFTLQENNVAIKEEHLKEAESHMELENELGLHMFPKIK